MRFDLKPKSNRTAGERTDTIPLLLFPAPQKVHATFKPPVNHFCYSTIPFLMTRRRERIGAGQTTNFVKPVSARAIAPLSTRSPTSLPGARAQTATLPHFDRPQGARGSRRASTASSKGGGTRFGAINAHPRQGIFISQAPYEARESDKFYTTSTVCKLSRIFSDSSLIQPAWSKVATSPWGEAAQVTGGYGERSLNGANSVECPDFMFSKRFGGHVKNFSFKKRSRPFAYHGEANTAVSHDTPSFFRAPHTQVYGQPIEKIHKPRLLKIQLGGQIIAEPEVPETDVIGGGPLDWGGLQVSGSSLAVQK